MNEAGLLCLIQESATVEEVPEIRLHRWIMRRDQRGNCRLIGFMDDGSTARVSTPIIEFDTTTNRGRTASGRVYELVGPAGDHPESELAWLCYRMAYGLREDAGTPS